MAPPKQGTLIGTRFPDPILEQIDKRRARLELTRAEAIRRMVVWALKQPENREAGI